jgi:hypothetical protein
MEAAGGSASALYYSAAAATALAGILHLMLAPGNGFNVNNGIFTGPSTDGVVKSNAGSMLMLKLAKDGGEDRLSAQFMHILGIR